LIIAIVLPAQQPAAKAFGQGVYRRGLDDLVAAVFRYETQIGHNYPCSLYVAFPERGVCATKDRAFSCLEQHSLLQGRFFGFFARKTNGRRITK
jgi:hypothetical protein